MDSDIIKELKKEYPDNITDIELLCTLLDKVGDSSSNQRIILIEDAQQKVNYLYNLKESDVLIDVQVIINKYRNKYDVTDPREVIHTDNGKGYVQ